MDDCTPPQPPPSVSPPTIGTPTTTVPAPSHCCRHIALEPEPRRVVVDPRDKIEVTC